MVQPKADLCTLQSPLEQRWPYSHLQSQQFFLLSEALLQHAECVQCNLDALEQIEIRIEPVQMMQGHAKPAGQLLWLLCSQGHQSYMPASDCLIRVVLMKAPEKSCCT